MPASQHSSKHDKDKHDKDKQDKHEEDKQRNFVAKSSVPPTKPAATANTEHSMASLAVGSGHREPSLGSAGLVMSDTEHSTDNKGVTTASTAENG